MTLLGHRIDPRIVALSQDDWEFVYSAIEAGWTTPQIMRDMPHATPSAVFTVTRAVRQEMRHRLRVCEHCRREIATGRRAA